MPINVEQINIQDDLSQIVSDINGAEWDDDNEISPYEVESLEVYLQRQDTVFVVAYNIEGDSKIFLGMASGRIEIKPYGKELWLYVDEVDVCVNQRKKGAGKAIMEKLLAIADEADCEEVWLGTEVDNDPANALYRSLDPDDVGEVVGYTYELDD